MLNYLFHFFTGYVIIKIEGIHIENFINICVAEKINISRLCYHGKEYATGKISPAFYHRAKLYARDHGLRISVLKKVGLPFLLQRLKKKKTLCVGFFVVCFIIFWLCSRIWIIDILETDPGKRAVISDILNENGVVCGMRKQDLQPSALQQDVLALNDQFSWFWVEVKGTHATVDVRYRKQPPEIINKEEICNITARESGVINKMIVRMGEAKVTVGTAVKKGQVLVSGIVPSTARGSVYVRSDADITAVVTKERSLSLPLTTYKRIKTGNVAKKYSVTLFGKELNLFIKTPDFKHYDGVIHEKPLKLFGEFFIPVNLKIYEYSQVEISPVKKTKEEAENELKTALSRELEETFGKDNILSSAFETFVEKGVVTVRLTASCLENIAEKNFIKIE